MKYKKKVLKNGLRMIVVPMEDAPSVTVMSLVEAGSKYETKEQNGLSHFLEHMCFKGTLKRSKSSNISLEFDSIGAQNNAFTGQEVTGYWGKAHPKHTDKLLDLISDMYLNPTFPADDLEREKGVIIEEINMYEDMPHRIVYDVWAELLYGDQPAGWSIAGPKENIKKFTRDDFVNYRRDHYVASATTIVVSGNVNAPEIFKKIEKYFKDIPTSKNKNKKKVVEAQKAPQVKIKFKETDQTHLILGVRAFDMYDKRGAALKVLSTVLGSGMSSRLFQKMREELGICYYARAWSDLYTDHGVLGVSAGVDSNRVEEAIYAILGELKKIRDEKVGEAELRKAKDYHIGNLYLGLESSDSLADFYGFQEIFKQDIKSPKEMEKEIEKVTAADLQKLAKTLLKNQNLNLAIVGKYNDEERFKKILSL